MSPCWKEVVLRVLRQKPRDVRTFVTLAGVILHDRNPCDTLNGFFSLFWEAMLCPLWCKFWGRSFPQETLSSRLFCRGSVFPFRQGRRGVVPLRGCGNRYRGVFPVSKFFCRCPRSRVLGDVQSWRYRCLFQTGSQLKARLPWLVEIKPSKKDRATNLSFTMSVTSANFLCV